MVLKFKKYITYQANKFRKDTMQIIREKLLINVTPEYPSEVYIEITNNCNLNCVMCPRRHLNRKLGDMNFDLFKKCIDEISQFNPQPSVLLTFLGEPLMHKKVLDMVRYSKGKGLNASLISNGCLLNKEIADALIEMQLDRITFSIDAVTQGTYDKIRINSDFNRVQENINYLIDKKKKLNAQFPIIQTSMVIQEENQSEYEDFIDTWIDKVDQVYFQRVFEDREGGIGRQISARDAFQLDKGKKKPCYYLWQLMVVYCDGQVTTCPPDDFGILTMGDVTTQSLYDIWHSEQYNRLRRKHIRNDIKDKKPCLGCDYWRGYVLKSEKVNFRGRSLVKSENSLCIAYTKRKRSYGI
ncbi:MAG: radical SAM protein [Nitrospirae bacterium]|nr:radical SAM protein [Nitrospirota bacterium]